MNLRKTEYRLKNPKKLFKDIKYSTQPIIRKNHKKLIPNLSCNNFFHKSRQRPLFLKTINQFDFDKLLLKKSSSNLFRSNDVDLVHNLNFDHMGQINENTSLRENLITNSLQNKTKEKEEEEKMYDFLEENTTQNENENKKDELELPKILELNKFNKYKSYELIQNHKKKIQNEMSEQIEKELINKIKSLRNNMNKKKIEKNEIFKKIKKIESELDDIYMENFFSKEKYKKQIDEIVKKTIEERKEEEIKNKAQAKLEAKKKKYFKSGNFHMEIFKQNKAETNINNSENSHNNSESTNKNTNINNLPNTSSNANSKNENPKYNFDKLNSLKNNDYSINNPNNSNNSNSKKSITKKSLENFKINLLQTQRKKEFDNFQSKQREKQLALKLELKNLENDLNKINKESDNLRKEEREIINKLMVFYKELLFKGKETKKDGLVWIIKSIWYLGENVPISFMPDYLDLESLEYLFQLAHKQLEIEYFNKKIREMKLDLKKDIYSKYKKEIIKLKIENERENENNKNHVINKKEIYRNMKKESNETENENKKNIYADLLKEFEEKNFQLEIMNLPELSRINNVKKHIEKIRKDIIELKKNEIKRISKCFIENNYEDKYHTNIETVLTALIGTDAKDTAMNKFNIDKKNYLAKLKKIRFFDHEHIRKIMSKY